MKYTFCTIAIGEKYLLSALQLAEQLNKVSNKHHLLIVSDDINHNIDNVTMVKIPNDKKLFTSKIFNYNFDVDLVQ
jgi:hypothetical protein